MQPAETSMRLQSFRQPPRDKSRARWAKQNERTLGILRGLDCAIDRALLALQAELERSKGRSTDAGDRASLAAGNGCDEYLTREAADQERLRILEEEMRQAAKALGALNEQIAVLHGMRRSLYTLLLRDLAANELPG
jgi:hypothetical protein